jgi:hypothetical protein
MIPCLAKPAQSFEAFPEAPSGMTFNQGIKRLDDVLIRNRSRNLNSVVGRTGKPDTATASLYGQPVFSNEIDNSVSLLERPQSFFSIRSFKA